MIIEIQEICKRFNVSIYEALRISDKYSTFAFCSNIVSNDIENKLTEYIHKQNK